MNWLVTARRSPPGGPDVVSAWWMRNGQRSWEAWAFVGVTDRSAETRLAVALARALRNFGIPTRAITLHVDPGQRISRPILLERAAIEVLTLTSNQMIAGQCRAMQVAAWAARDAMSFLLTAGWRECTQVTKPSWPKLGRVPEARRSWRKLEMATPTLISREGDHPVAILSEPPAQASRAKPDASQQQGAHPSSTAAGLANNYSSITN